MILRLHTPNHINSIVKYNTFKVIQVRSSKLPTNYVNAIIMRIEYCKYITQKIQKSHNRNVKISYRVKLQSYTEKKIRISYRTNLEKNLIQVQNVLPIKIIIQKELESHKLGNNFRISYKKYFENLVQKQRCYKNS